MPSYVDLYWLPLGAGGHVVRRTGRLYEALASRAQRRAACDLYHAALEIRAGDDMFVIEVAPAWSGPAGDRGVVAVGAVGARRAGRFRLFRYEVRRWRGGLIPDVADAVDSPLRLSEDPGVARRVLDAVPDVPTMVWGLDELETGDMWNSNSTIAWLLARGGIDAGSIRPPAGGRAPGWDAGVVVAGLRPRRAPRRRRAAQAEGRPAAGGRPRGRRAGGRRAAASARPRGGAARRARSGAPSRW